MADGVLLDLFALLPADIVLTRSENPISALIATMTGGQFSHAALVCEPNSWFEATQSGVGYNGIIAVKFEHNGLRPDRLLARLEYTELRVVRPHDNGAIAPDSMMDKLTQLTADEEWVKKIGQDYPLWECLSTAMHLPFPATVTREVLTQLENHYRDREALIPGMFCSQLVVTLLRDLKVEVVHEKRLPETVNPNDLARSNLVSEVTGVFVMPDESIENHRAALESYNTRAWTTKNTRETMSLMRDRLARSYRQVEQISERLSASMRAAEIAKALTDTPTGGAAR